MKPTKIIKSIYTIKYDIALIELPNSKYCIIYETDDKADNSEHVADLNTALFLFDTKLQDLEGH